MSKLEFRSPSRLRSLPRKSALTIPFKIPTMDAALLASLETTFNELNATRYMSGACHFLSLERDQSLTHICSRWPHDPLL